MDTQGEPQQLSLPLWMDEVEHDGPDDGRRFLKNPPPQLDPTPALPTKTERVPVSLADITQPPGTRRVEREVTPDVLPGADTSRTPGVVRIISFVKE